MKEKGGRGNGKETEEHGGNENEQETARLRQTYVSIYCVFMELAMEYQRPTFANQDSFPPEIRKWPKGSLTSAIENKKPLSQKAKRNFAINMDEKKYTHNIKHFLR